MDNFILLKKVFVKRFFIILLVGLLGASLAAMEKYQTKDVQIQAGTVVTVTEVQFTDPDENKASYPFQYSSFIRSVGNVCKFIYRLEKEDSVDMAVINSDWKKLSVEKKYLWITKYVLVDFFGDGKCQLAMYMDVNMPKDAEQCGEEAKKFVNLYLDSSLEELKTVKPNVQMTIKSTEEYKPEIVTMSQKNLVIKYAIIGFALGIMLATIAFFIATSRKE